MATIIKTCPMCHGETIFNLDADKVKRWREDREVIQNVFPDLSVEDREILVSGVHPECWKKLMREESS